MQESMRYAVGLDIGTTHVRCVIGSQVGGSAGGTTIVGVGSAPNNGMRKGVVVNIVATAQAIDKALDEAERMSGHQVTSSAININGPHIISMSSKGVVAVSSENREITPGDLLRAEEAATVVQLPANREILQVTPRSYQLDGQENIKDPLGMSGVRLEVDAHVITALSPHLKNLTKSLEMTETNVSAVLVSVLASAKAVLSPQQTENGVAVLDFGGTTTGLAVFEEGDLQHVAVLPMGSVNVTNDLAIGLRTDLDIAEIVKLGHASALPPEKGSPKTVELKHGDDTVEFDHKDIAMIVEARLDEIFELVDKELSVIGRSGKLPGGIVLTGGGANLRHIAQYARQKLRLPVRVAKLDGFGGMSDSIAKPEFAAALGLMLADLEAASSAEKPSSAKKKQRPNNQRVTNLFKSAADIFKKFKP